MHYVQSDYFSRLHLLKKNRLSNSIRERGRIWGTEGLQGVRFDRTVPSGTTQLINFHVSLNPDCTSEGAVTVRVTKEPEHGKVEVTPR